MNVVDTGGLAIRDQNVNFIPAIQVAASNQVIFPAVRGRGADVKGSDRCTGFIDQQELQVFGSAGCCCQSEGQDG